MSKAVVYFETNDSVGHGETHQELNIKAMLALQWHVILIAYCSQQTTRWLQDLEAAEHDRFYVYRLSEQPRLGLEKCFVWYWANNQIRKAEAASTWKVDMVYFAAYDTMRRSLREAMFTRFLFHYSWVGLYITPVYYHPQATDRLPRKKKARLIDFIHMCFGHCKGIGIQDKNVLTGLQKWIANVPVVVFPQITDTTVAGSLETESIKRQARGRCIIGLLGVLHPRKGLRNFLRIAYESDSNKTFFVLAGNFDIDEYPAAERAEILRLLEINGRDNCCFRLTHTDNPLEFNALVDCCDVLYLVYREHFHSSGLLAKAAMFRKPVIVSRGYCMGEQVEMHNLGIAVNGNDYEDVLAAVLLISEPGVRKKLLASADFAGYCRQNDVGALQDALQQLLYPRT